MDVKPENIYIKNGVYKLGDFGCATLMDRSLRIEDGDSRYMPFGDICLMTNMTTSTKLI